VNKIESKTITPVLFVFTFILAVLAHILFPAHKPAHHKYSNNKGPIKRYALLFVCLLKVPNIVLAMNFIAFYKTSGWIESMVFLKNGNPDFRLDPIQRKVKTMEVD
jgi:hypothetical protein